VTLLTGLTHRNLPRVYEHFTDPLHWYLVMDFIEGETLEEYLKHTQSGILPLEDVLEIAIQLCTVLDYLHKRHPPIIFRDLKPANIMRTPMGRIYLIDFGTARHLKPGQEKDTIALGSPGYAAPEQYGSAQTTQQSDVYSLGATLHHLLTGNDPSENPFRLPPVRTLQATLPVALETLLTEMLELKASERPASIAGVKERLQRIQEQHTRALYTLPPASIVNQVAQPYYVPGGVQQRQATTPRSFFANNKRMLINLGVTLTVLTVIVGSCTFFLANFRLSFHAAGTVRSDMPNLAPASQQVYRNSLIGMSDLTLDPTQVIDPQAANVVSMLYTGLVSQDHNHYIRPQLALSFDVSADGLTWTFHLRSNLRFSDGTSLTSQDVAYSLDRALQPATASAGCLNNLGLIKDADKLVAGRISTLIGDSILTPDVTTVIITVRQPEAYFLAALSIPCSSVVERSLVDKYGKHFSDHLQEGGGDGPFKLSRYTPGKEIDLVPNPNYYGPNPRLQEVTFTFYKDSETSYKAYMANQVDETPVPISHLNQARNLPMEFHLLPQQTISYYAMNYLVKPFDNIHMRQAFALAIDKSVISSAVWRDTVRPTCHIVPEGIPGYNPKLTCPTNAPISGDPARAKALLQQALQEEGYTSVTQLPPITFTYAPNPATFANEAMAVQQMWQRVLGIQVKLQPVSLSTLFSKIAAAAGNPHGLQFWASSWSAEYPDPHDWLTLQFDQGSPFNSMNYGQNNGAGVAGQQAVQRQMEDTDVQLDVNLRSQMLASTEQQLVNDVAWLPMYQANMSLLIKPYMTYQYIPVSTTPSLDDWSYIYVAVH
jgi:peptide/nickel transport system substrate-binding protein/oligopeptide transport system substrate-binding protein